MNTPFPASMSPVRRWLRRVVRAALALAGGGREGGVLRDVHAASARVRADGTIEFSAPDTAGAQDAPARPLCFWLAGEHAGRLLPAGPAPVAVLPSVRASTPPRLD